MKARLINNIEKELATFAKHSKIKTGITQRVHVTPKCTEVCDGYTFIRVTPNEIANSDDFPHLGIEGNTEFETVQIDSESLAQLKPTKLGRSALPILQNFQITIKDNNVHVSHTNLENTTTIQAPHDPIDWVDEKNYTPPEKPNITIELSVDKFIRILQLLKKDKAESFSLSLWDHKNPIKIESNSNDNHINGLLMSIRRD